MVTVHAAEDARIVGDLMIVERSSFDKDSSVPTVINTSARNHRTVIVIVLGSRQQPEDCS
jgi:hypothetical protein